MSINGLVKFLTLIFLNTFIIQVLKAQDGIKFRPFPKKLSDWNLLKREKDTMVLNEDTVPYYLVNSLFTDYAKKFRFIWLPKSKKITYKKNEILDFPVGSVISKTFFYNRYNIILLNEEKISASSHFEVTNDTLDFKDAYLIETRLLVKEERGWIGLPYLWNKEQTDAVLKITGSTQKMKIKISDKREENFTYTTPNFNQCKGCHIKSDSNYKKTITPIGTKAKNMNLDRKYNGQWQNQLSYLEAKDFLSDLPTLENVPKVTNWQEITAPLKNRARSYLDINCAHCHNPQGPAKTSGLFLQSEENKPANYGVCKVPIAAGNASGGRKYDIHPGSPERSILTYRMNSTDPGKMMPEIGRSLVDQEGLELIHQWILDMSPGCK